MPEATPFIALGVGNGFPACDRSYEVSTQAHWTTLSGVNKDNVEGFTDEELDEKIQESFILASKLYRSSFSVDALSEAEYVNGATNWKSTADGADVSESDYSEPQTRACGHASGESGEQVGDTFADIALDFYQPPKFLNNGIFVGYGGRYGTESIVFLRANSISSAVTQLTLYGTISLEQTSSANTTYDYAYVDLDGMSFVCAAYARRTISTATLIADAANLTAESSTTSPNTRIAKSSIAALGFYTYA